MSAIIWWLESAWQIRALVFIMAFLACFVAPYLYTAGKVGTASTKKPVQVEAVEKPAAKAEASVQDVKAPAPQEAPPPQAVPDAEPPAETAEASKPETETSIPVHEHPQALAETPAQHAEAPAAPAPQEAVAPEPPAQPEIPAVQPQKAAFHFSSKAAKAVSLPALGLVEKREMAVSSETGGSAEVEVHVLPSRAGRRTRAARRGLSAYLDSGAFAKSAPLYDAVVCVGLGSKGEPISTPELLRRANRGDFAPCGLLARKPHLSMNAKLYGLPLARALDGARRAEKRRMRPHIVVGIKSAKGDLADFATQRRMIANLIRENRIAAGGPGESPKATAVKPPRYVAVKGGKPSKKHRSVRQTPKLPECDDLLDRLESLIQPESWSFKDEVSGRQASRRANRPRHSRAQSNALPAGSRRAATW